MELAQAQKIADAINDSAQLGLALEPVIEIAGECFRLDKVSTVGRAAGFTAEMRFWEKVKKSEGCWLWVGAKNTDGYGLFRIKNHATDAHRIAYALRGGHIPTGLSVLHSCDNRACVRPEHLFLGTQLDNVNDMAKKGRDHKARGDRNASRLYPEKRLRGDMHPFRLHPELHARGERAANAKLKEDQVIEMRRIWEARALSQHALARKYGVTLTTVNSIVLGKTWRHLLWN